MTRSVEDQWAQDRFALGVALLALGHDRPDLVISRALEVADLIACAEMAGADVSPELRAEAHSLSTYLPALWQFVIAGHQGGGSLPPRPESLISVMRNIVAGEKGGGR